MIKKRLAFILSILLLFSGCSMGNFCLHEYKSVVTERAYAFREGTMTYTCQKCEHSYTETIPATGKLKLLMIGNSFSEDASSYLWKICKEGKDFLEDVTVAVAYIGASTLDDHWNNIQNNTASYEYQKNTDGNLVRTPGKTLSDIVEDEQWDVIAVQQQSTLNSSAESLSHLNDIIDWVKWYQPQAQVYYHMTWAHSSTSTDAKFLAACGGDRDKFHGSVVEVVQNEVIPNKQICGVIASGTLIQNLSYSYLGEGPLYRDTLHLSNSYGRYAVALLWYAYVLGGDIYQINWVPKLVEGMDEDLPLIREAVQNALTDPFVITACETEKPTAP